MDRCYIMRSLGTPKQATCPKCGFTRISSSIKGETQCSNCGKYFIFDRERWRKYKKDWKKKNPEKYRARTARHNKKLSKLYDELREQFGNKCDLLGCCNKRLEFHERNGNEHPLNSIYIRDHIQDFVLLCQSCHEATHWAMEKLGWDYDRFKQNINLWLMTGDIRFTDLNL